MMRSLTIVLLLIGMLCTSCSEAVTPSTDTVAVSEEVVRCLTELNDKALEETQLAVELDPHSPRYHADYALVNANLGNLDKTISEATIALELNPDDPYALFILGAGYAAKGMFDEAIKVQIKASQITPDWNWGLALTYIASGQRDKALMIAKDLERQAKVWDTWCLASIYAVMGEKEKFFEWFEAAYQQRHPWMPWMIVNSEFWTDYMNDPRFVEIAEELNLPQL